MRRQVLSLAVCILTVYAIGCGPRKDPAEAQARAFQAALSRDLPPGSSYEKVKRYLTAHHVPYDRDRLQNRIKFTVRRDKPWLDGIFHRYRDLDVAIDFDDRGVERQLRVMPGIQGFRVKPTSVNLGDSGITPPRSHHAAWCSAVNNSGKLAPRTSYLDFTEGAVIQLAGQFARVSDD